MRVLIVVALQSRMQTYQLPLGIGYVSASLKRAGHDVRVLNPNHSLDDLPALLRKDILEFCPEVISAGGMAFHLNQIRQIASLARHLAPHTPIVIGGPLVSNQPETAMRAIPEADIGIIGEAEQTIAELIDALSKGSSLDLVPGIIGRTSTNNQFKKTPARVLLDNLDALPWIDYEGLGLDIFAGLHGPGDVAPGLIVDDNARVMPFLTSRGCPFPCTFCCHEAAGKRYRSRSLDDVFAELEHNIDRFGINTLFIYDDLFSLKRQRLEEFCERVRPLNLRWECSIRVEQVTPQALKMMRDSGCACISFGVESMSPTVLASMRKKTTREALDQALGQMYDAKITTWANLIFGDPAETWDTAMDTLDWWIDHNQFDLRTAFIGYHPGSQIYDDALRNGLIKDPLAFLLGDQPEINATAMSDEEYRRLKLRVDEVIYTFGFCGQILEMAQSAQGYDIKTNCPHCASENQYRNVIFRKNVVMRISCRDCNQLYRLPVIYRPPPTQQLMDLIQEINRLIWDVDPQGNTDIGRIYSTTKQALGIDATQEQLWGLMIKISTNAGDPELRLKTLRQAVFANPFQPQLFDQLHTQLMAAGDTREAERCTRQAAHLRSVGVLGAIYYS